jgi:hypothetical protein
MQIKSIIRKKPHLRAMGFHPHNPELPTNDVSKHAPSNQNLSFQRMADFDRQCEQWYRDHAFSTSMD